MTDAVEKVFQFGGLVGILSFSVSGYAIGILASQVARPIVSLRVRVFS